MKKIIYTLLFVFAAIFSITSCTEEEVKPQSDLASNGGASVRADLP